VFAGALLLMRGFVMKRMPNRIGTVATDAAAGPIGQQDVEERFSIMLDSDFDSIWAIARQIDSPASRF
jgi:hypothetical protein